MWSWMMPQWRNSAWNFLQIALVYFQVVFMDNFFIYKKIEMRYLTLLCDFVPMGVKREAFNFRVKMTYIGRNSRRYFICRHKAELSMLTFSSSYLSHWKLYFCIKRWVLITQKTAWSYMCQENQMLSL